MNNREQKHRCHVCQMYTASLRIGGDIYICDDCNMIFFYDLKTISEKLQRYAVAKELVLKLKITLRVALGVAKDVLRDGESRTGAVNINPRIVSTP